MSNLIKLNGELGSNLVSKVLADSTLIRGGYMSVETLSERDSLTDEVRSKGTTVYVRDTGLKYVWNGSSWIEDTTSIVWDSF